jgi:hypothetical protein
MRMYHPNFHYVDCSENDYHPDGSLLMRILDVDIGENIGRLKLH